MTEGIMLSANTELYIGNGSQIPGDNAMKEELGMEGLGLFGTVLAAAFMNLQNTDQQTEDTIVQSNEVTDGETSDMKLLCEEDNGICEENTGIQEENIGTQEWLVTDNSALQVIVGADVKTDETMPQENLTANQEVVAGTKIAQEQKIPQQIKNADSLSPPENLSEVQKSEIRKAVTPKEQANEVISENKPVNMKEDNEIGIIVDKDKGQEFSKAKEASVFVAEGKTVLTGNESNYQKEKAGSEEIRAPEGKNNVTAEKVGIAAKANDRGSEKGSEKNEGGKTDVLQHLPKFSVEQGNTSDGSSFKISLDNADKTPVMRAGEIDSKLPDVLVSTVKTDLKKDGSKELLVRLEPKELGKVVVKLTSREGVVSVKMFAENREAGSLLENSMNNLRQSLHDTGIKYGRMDVEVGGEFINQQQNQHQHNGWSKGRDQIYSADGMKEMMASDETEPQKTPSWNWTNNGKVDYIA